MQNMTQRQFIIIIVVVAAVAFFAARLGFASQGAPAQAAPPSNYSQPFFSQPVSKPETLNPVQPGLSNGVRDLNPVQPSQSEMQQQECVRLGYSKSNWPNAGCR